MKKILAKILAYSFYFLGDLVSKFMWNGFTYRIYRELMYWSSEIQDWGKLDGPWKDVTEDDEI